MKEGIYRVVFESHLSAVGEGIAVVTGDRVYGGDIAFTCRGVLTRPSVRLSITHFDPEVPSTLGMEGDYMLEMRYERTGEDGYCFTGHVVGYPERRLTARAWYLVPLLPETVE